MAEQSSPNGREVVVLSAVRTAIGKYGGGLKDVPPSELAAQCVRESVKRSGVCLLYTSPSPRDRS